MPILVDCYERLSDEIFSLNNFSQSIDATEITVMLIVLGVTCFGYETLVGTAYGGSV
jgi:hypothetical protein